MTVSEVGTANRRKTVEIGANAVESGYRHVGKRISVGKAVDVAVAHLSQQGAISSEFHVRASWVNRSQWLIVVGRIPSGPGWHATVYVDTDGSIGDVVPGA